MSSLFGLAALVFGLSPASAQQTISSELVATGFDRPVQVTAPPGDFDRLFVVEQHSGRIKIIKNGSVLAAPFLDLSGVSSSSISEHGLLGLAFHPDYANNRTFFVYYTHEITYASYLVSYQASPLDPDLALPSSATTVLTVDQSVPGHKGGSLAFSPLDGTLYLGLGDGGGNGNAPSAQDPQILRGKILRLDVDLPHPHIPANNPFIADPQVRDEIWALGVRQPWRLSFDSQTGDLYMADVSGPANREEINVERAGFSGGRNYGWPCMDGTECAPFTGCTCNDPALTLPVHQYPHAMGNCAIIGGHVYRGCAIPGLRGYYIYGDHCNGRMWTLRYDPAVGVVDLAERTSELTPPVGAINFLTSFGQDALGEIYFTDLDGDIFKIVPGSGSAGVAYCSGKTNSLGCVPFVSTDGLASATSGRFFISADHVVPNKPGLILYGFHKRDLDFHGGKLCVKGPLRRFLPLRFAKAAGTNPSCPGVIKRDFNLRIQGGIDPMLTAGQQVSAQWYLRDPSDPTGFGDSLSDAVRFVICP